MHLKKSMLVLFLVFFSGFFYGSRPVQAASAARIYVMTSTYGTLTGALAGLASLAFYSSPGTHTRNVAMGASLGLYAGLLMGTYIVYVVPDKKKEKANPNTNGSPEENPLRLDSSAHQSVSPTELYLPRLMPSFVIGQRGEPMVGFSYIF